MLLKNSLLQYTNPQPRTVRVLALEPARDRAYLFDMGVRSSMPVIASLSTLRSDLAHQRAAVLAYDAFAEAVDTAALPAKYLALRERAWHILSSLPLDNLALFANPRQRGALIARHSDMHGISYPTLYRYLRRYWERGQHLNALLPDYSNSGAPGKTRNSTANVKRGRPRKSGPGIGLNADANIRLTFRAAVNRYAQRHETFCRRAAYRQMIEEFFSAVEAEALPSFGQFNYWIEKDACLSLAPQRNRCTPPAGAERPAPL